MAETQLNADPISGKFRPANTWRFKPGTSGHKLRFPPNRLIKRIQAHIDTREDGQRLTKAGLARSLGMSMTALQMYYDGKVGKSDAM